MIGHDRTGDGKRSEPAAKSTPVIRQAHDEAAHGIFFGSESLAPRAFVLLAGVMLVVAIPARAPDEGGATLLWFTVALLFAIAAYAVIKTKIARANPWIAPISLLLGLYFMKYGAGLLLLYYWEDLPFTDFTDLGLVFATFRIRENIGTTCHIILIGGCGLYLGASQPMTRVSALLPTLRWPIDRSKFNQNLMLYTPIAVLLVAWTYYYLPLTIRDTVLLFGWIVFVLIVIASYEFFSSPLVGSVRWFFAILLMYGAVFSVFLSTGMREHAVKPALMVVIGYVLARRRFPFRIIVPLIPALVLFALPWLTLYKTVDVGETGLAEKIAATNQRLASVSVQGRLELSTAGTLARLFVGGPAFVSTYSQFYPSVYPYELGRSMIDQALSLIPRVAWPDKPNLSAQLNIYTRKVGILPEAEFDPGSTTATFDAISEYYINFGLAGVLLLSIAHGMYVRLLYEWLVVRSAFLIGAGCYAVVILLNHDFFGVFQMFLAHTRQLVVWPLVLYFMSRRSG